MPRMIFVNLPVADLAKSTAFYEAIGGRKDPHFSNDVAAMMVFSDTIAIMLLSRDYFATFTARPIADARQATEVLICLSAESRTGVDELTESAIAAAGGAGDFRPPQDHGFMYGRSVEDPDGHVLEFAWMDVAAATGGNAAAA
ncbi:MAG TPA: VOC family protein [Sphingomonadaceae bacterium]|nr:VOC family protein [Sphingomonadaceae bacterium]